MRDIRATVDSMVSAKQIVGQLLELPEHERSELALALLDMLEGPDAAGDLSPEQFREEIVRRAEDALANPSAGGDWVSLREELSRDSGR